MYLHGDPPAGSDDSCVWQPCAALLAGGAEWCGRQGGDCQEQDVKEGKLQGCWWVVA